MMFRICPHRQSISYVADDIKKIIILSYSRFETQILILGFPNTGDATLPDLGLIHP